MQLQTFLTAVEAPKKKVNKSNIPVSEVVYGAMLPADVQQAVEKEFEMALQDCVMEETKDKKNVVEAYGYQSMTRGTRLIKSSAREASAAAAAPKVLKEVSPTVWEQKNDLCCQCILYAANARLNAANMQVEAPKKKVNKSNIPVSEVVYGAMLPADVQQAVEKEFEMALQDCVVECDVFLVNSEEIIRPNLSIREGIGQLIYESVAAYTDWDRFNIVCLFLVTASLKAPTGLRSTGIQELVSKKFMTGCVVLFPVVVTFIVTWWNVQFFDGFFSPIYERLGVEIFELELKSFLLATDQNTTAFKDVAIIRHPRLGEYIFGFITSSVVL
ncbi:COV 2-like protein [Tanacetum coccineum]